MLGDVKYFLKLLTLLKKQELLSVQIVMNSPHFYQLNECSQLMLLQLPYLLFGQLKRSFFGGGSLIYISENQQTSHAHVNGLGVHQNVFK